MTRDLFSLEDEFRAVDVADAEVLFQENFDVGRPPSQLLAELIRETPWRSEQIVVWGKSHPQPRLVAWFGDSGKGYVYSGIRLTPLPWTPTLSDIKGKVETRVGVSFNSVLLNYYRNERDSMGFHSDDEPELGLRPTIASLSFGEMRTFILKHKFSKTIKPIRIPLSSGSLLVMKGDTQRNWKHGIDKEAKPCGPRVNLTFRNILPKN